jgi:hypothetical protein
VLAGGIGQKITSIFFEPACTEIVELVGFTLLDRDQRKPATAFTAAAAGADCLRDRGVFYRKINYLGAGIFSPAERFTCRS